MGRWQPDAQGRLERAALQLFTERGYAGTTVEDIAAAAGLTERTFFRYFSDKREVLFGGSAQLERVIVERIAAAPATAAPIEVVAAAVEAAGEALQRTREPSYVRARHALLTVHPELQERELIKLSTLAAAVAQALRARGVSEPTASLVAEAGIAIFKVGFERWIGAKKPRDLPGHIRAATEALRAAAGPATPATRRARTTA